jgi:hypothetical protein
MIADAPGIDYNTNERIEHLELTDENADEIKRMIEEGNR